MHSTSDGLGSGASSLSTHKGVRKTMLQVRLHLLQQSSSFSLSQAASCPHCHRQSLFCRRLSRLRRSHYGYGRNILLASPGTLGLLGRCRSVWLHFHFVLWLLLLLKMLQRHRHDLTHGTQQKKCGPVGIALTVFGSAT